MVSDAEAILREKLRVALQDAKNLYDEGLLDEKEFKDLKAHELGKYKEQLAALTTSDQPSRPAERTTPPSERKQPAPNGAAGTPLRTPVNIRMRHEASRPSPGSVETPPSVPHTPSERIRPNKEDILVLDANTYARLTTPPIFRRRSRNKKKIRIPCAELKALQGLTEENANSS